MKLNNCPFCNHELDTGDVLDIGRLAFCVHCPKCLAYGPKAQSKELAIEKWNEASKENTKPDDSLQKIADAANRLVNNYTKYCKDDKDNIESKLLLSTNVMTLAVRLEKAKLR